MISSLFRSPVYHRACLKGFRKYASGIQVYKLYNTLRMVHTIAWKQIKPSPDTKHGTPLSRSSHSVEYTKGGTLYILGGEHIARTPLNLTQFTWALSTNDPTSWRMVPIQGETFPSRVAHASTYCESKDTIYMFGGREGIDMNETALNDLWSFDVTTETWSMVKTSPAPEARSFHKMVCIGETLYLFGGCGTSGRLADLHSFDTNTGTWTDLRKSVLRGRGGANVIALPHLNKIAVVAGFAGEETCDGQMYDISKGQWDEKLTKLEAQLRPRSVCISGLFQSEMFLFGGEVDPSHKGHDGAGGFEGDVIFLAEDGEVLERVASKESEWPESRGWGDGSAVKNGFYVFGGLAGDDASPKRLDGVMVLL